MLSPSAQRNMQPYFSFPPDPKTAVEPLTWCLEMKMSRMKANKLKLSPDKNGGTLPPNSSLGEISC